MRVGDVVHIHWHPEQPNYCHDAVGIIVEKYKSCFSVQLISIRPGVRGAFDAKDLTVLGHIDVAQEGEEL